MKCQQDDSFYVWLQSSAPVCYTVNNMRQATKGHGGAQSAEQSVSHAHLSGNSEYIRKLPFGGYGSRAAFKKRCRRTIK